MQHLRARLSKSFFIEALQSFLSPRSVIIYLAAIWDSNRIPRCVQCKCISCWKITWKKNNVHLNHLTMNFSQPVFFLKPPPQRGQVISFRVALKFEDKRILQRIWFLQLTQEKTTSYPIPLFPDSQVATLARRCSTSKAATSGQETNAYSIMTVPKRVLACDDSYHRLLIH